MGRAVRCVVLRGVHQRHRAVFGVCGVVCGVCGVRGAFGERGLMGPGTAAAGFCGVCAFCGVVDAIIGGTATTTATTATDVCAVHGGVFGGEMGPAPGLAAAAVGPAEGQGPTAEHWGVHGVRGL